MGPKSVKFQASINALELNHLWHAKYTPFEDHFTNRTALQEVDIALDHSASVSK